MTFQIEWLLQRETFSTNLVFAENGIVQKFGGQFGTTPKTDFLINFSLVPYGLNIQTLLFLSIGYNSYEYNIGELHNYCNVVIKLAEGFFFKQSYVNRFLFIF